MRTRAHAAAFLVHHRLIVVRIYTADNLARSFMDTITYLAVKGGGTP